MQRMADLILQVIQSAGMEKAAIGGIGIGVPGVLDLDKGRDLVPAQPGRHLAACAAAGYDRQI